MPNPGDQHTAIPNPFDQQQPAYENKQLMAAAPFQQRMSEYTAQEIATLQSRLEKQLGPEYISSRAGPSGQKVHYIAAEKVITLANEVFGFNGWSSSIQTIQVDFVDEHPQTLRVSVGLSVIIRVTLRDGTYHEDIGYGRIENCKGKAAAFEKAKKEGTTDGLKRALRNFGSVLGNCIYDKTYVDRVAKMKVTPAAKRPFDERALHRHADFAIKEEEETQPAPRAAAAAAAPPPPPPARPALGAAAPTEATTNSSTEADGQWDLDEDLLGDFDEADFCVADEGHPDEVIVPETTSVPSLPPPPPPQQHNQANSRSTSPVRQMPPQPNRPMGHNGMPLNRGPQTPNAMNNGRPSFPGNAGNAGNAGPRPPYQSNGSGYQQNRPPPPPAQRPGNNGMNNAAGSNNGAMAKSNGASTPKAGQVAPGDVEGTPWLSARAVAKVSGSTDGDALAVVAPAVQAGHLFNPKAESPSIRKTPGIDHHSSKPVPRISRPGAPSAPPGVPGIASTTGAGAASGPHGLTSGTGGGPLARAGNAAGPTPLHAHPHPHQPMADNVRRIGAPPSAASPLANRGQFRPPPMKRGPPTDTAGGGGGVAGNHRPPLADVSSNVAMNGGTAVAVGGGGGAPGVDAKRQKLA